MQSLFFTDLMQGLILFLVHLLPVDGIKMSLAKRKKKKRDHHASEQAGLCACGHVAFLSIVQ